MRALGRDDVAVLVGLFLIGVALWLGSGVPAVVGYVGALLVVFGVTAAWRGQPRA